MTTQGLPELPKRSTLDRKVATYRRNAEAHRRGEHAGRKVRVCKACAGR